MTGSQPRSTVAAAVGPVTVTMAAITAIATVCLLTACSGSGGPAPVTLAPSPAASAPSGATSGSVAWLVTRLALSQLVADAAVRSRLHGSRILEILSPGQQMLTGVPAEPVVTFPSAAALEAAVRGGQIAAGTYGVLYDPEAWSFTPAAEQRDPVAAAAQAAQVAHAHGLRLLVAPALNLTTVLDPGSSKPRWQRFLGLRLAARMASIADVVEIQAQSLERDTATYASFVRAAAAQARAAKTGVTVLAGLSTNPPGAPVTSQHLAGAIQATRARVDGYWLNIPGAGARCPTCNSPQPDVARQALQQVG